MSRPAPAHGQGAAAGGGAFDLSEISPTQKPQPSNGNYCREPDQKIKNPKPTQPIYLLDIKNPVPYVSVHEKDPYQMMYRNPDEIPLKPGVFALVNRRRKYAYVSYTGNLQKRSHSMSHMLLTYDADPKCYWPIRDLPKHASDEYTFCVERADDRHDGDNSLAAVANVQKRYIAKGYRIVSGHRATSPTVTLAGRKMTLADAVRDYSQVKYLTVYRRLERGWTIKQALGLEAPAPRWHHERQAERRDRERERAAA